MLTMSVYLCTLDVADYLLSDRLNRNLVAKAMNGHVNDYEL